MTISQTTSLSEPSGDQRIPSSTIAYFRARNRSRLYEFVVSAFEKSGISQATLARRMGKKPDVVSRLLSAPGNWEADTVSDLMFAISGGEARYAEARPLSAPKRNHDEPDWLNRSARSLSEGTPSRGIVTLGNWPLPHAA